MGFVMKKGSSLECKMKSVQITLKTEIANWC